MRATRAFLAAAATALLLASAHPSPARAFAGCTQAVGYVRDTAGRPIAGAVVDVDTDTEYCGRTTVMSDGTGRYVVQVANRGVNPSARAIASAFKYSTQQRTVYARPLIPSATVSVVRGTNDFELVRL
jgi:hypothetical protein